MLTFKNIIQTNCINPPSFHISMWCSWNNPQIRKMQISLFLETISRYLHTAFLRKNTLQQSTEAASFLVKGLGGGFGGRRRGYFL